MDILTINPADYGIVPDSGADLSENFKRMFDDCSGKEGSIKIELLPGVYDIFAKSAQRELTYITNTAGEREVPNHIHTYALILRNISDLELDGCGAELLLHGMMTNMFIDGCRNIKISNLTIDYNRPTVSEIEIVEKKAFSAVLKIHPDSHYRIKNGKLTFCDDNWTWSSTKKWTFPMTMASFATEPDRLVRTAKHPFFAATSVKELEPNLVKVNYFLPPAFAKGDRYAIGTNVRYEVGIFINRSDGITFKSVSQHYNHSHALVAQLSSDITLESVVFAPRKSSGRMIASHTDFLHFCLCSGNIAVRDSYFEGSNDDFINVHGVFWDVKSASNDEIIAVFKHHQTYGFNAFDPGDTVTFVNKSDLLPMFSTKVVSSEQVTPYTTKIILEERIPDVAKKNCVVENSSRNPNLDYRRNFLGMGTARGALITTAGHVDIVENTFKKTAMAGVFISDDCRAWYESGCVRDVNIESNRFIECGKTTVLIWPENQIHRGTVHSNINIENNAFHLGRTSAIVARSTENITVKSNTFDGSTAGQLLIRTIKCPDLSIRDNDLAENYEIERS